MECGNEDGPEKTAPLTDGEDYVTNVEVSQILNEVGFNRNKRPSQRGPDVDSETFDGFTSPTSMPGGISAFGNSYCLSNDTTDGMDGSDGDSAQDGHPEVLSRKRVKRPARKPTHPQGYFGAGYHSSSSHLPSPTGEMIEKIELESETDNTSLFPYSIPNKAVQLWQKTRPKLVILEQPSSQHRARYESEGSRGAVKDKCQEGSPKIQLLGYEETPVEVSIFVCNDKGSTKPHLYFSACKIASRTSTPCEEADLDIDGISTKAIKILLYPKDNMIGVIDCVGILKLRNADVENKYKQHLTKNKKKNNSIVRMAFRAQIPQNSETQNHETTRKYIEVLSGPVQCSQPEGQPEILDISTIVGSPEGEEKVILIGKNLNRNSDVIFYTDTWRASARINTDFPTSRDHLVVWTPKYYDTQIQQDVEVEVRIKQGDKYFEPFMKKFTYRKTSNDVLGMIQSQLQKGLQLNPSLLIELAKNGGFEIPQSTDNKYTEEDLMDIKQDTCQDDHMIERTKFADPLSDLVGPESVLSSCDSIAHSVNIDGQMSSPQLSSPRTGYTTVPIRSSPIDYRPISTDQNLIQDAGQTPTNNDVLPQNQFYPEPTGFTLSNDHSFSSQDPQGQNQIAPVTESTLSPREKSFTESQQVGYNQQDSFNDVLYPDNSLPEEHYTHQQHQQSSSSTNTAIYTSSLSNQGSHPQIVDDSCHNTSYNKQEVSLLTEQDVYESLQSTCLPEKTETKDEFSDVQFSFETDLMQMKDIKPLENTNSQHEAQNFSLPPSQLLQSQHLPEQESSFSQLRNGWNQNPMKVEAVADPPVVQIQQVAHQDINMHHHQQHLAESDWNPSPMKAEEHHHRVEHHLPEPEWNPNPMKVTEAHHLQQHQVDPEWNPNPMKVEEQQVTNSWTTSPPLPDQDVVMTQHAVEKTMTFRELQEEIAKGVDVVIAQPAQQPSLPEATPWQTSVPSSTNPSEQYDSIFQTQTQPTDNSKFQ